MNDQKLDGGRLLGHLTAATSEEERQDLEREVLEDDALFERLSVAEGELVDAYLHGELDEKSSRGVGSLIGVSPRLQATADTTLALKLQQPGLADGSSAGRRSTGRFPRWIGALALAAILVWLLLQAAGQKSAMQQLAAEHLELRQRNQQLEVRVDDLEASNRALLLALARLEAKIDRPRVLNPRHSDRGSEPSSRR